MRNKILLQKNLLHIELQYDNRYRAYKLLHRLLLMFSVVGVAV